MASEGIVYTKAQKRNLRRTRINKELREAKSKQEIEITSTSVQGTDRFKVRIMIYDYDGGTVTQEEFSKSTPFEDIRKHFIDVIELTPSDILIDAPPVTKTVPRKYASNKHFDSDYDSNFDGPQCLAAEAYEYLMKRSNGTWKPKPYNPDCGHERPECLAEAAYFELMDETGGKWKPDRK